MNKFDLLNILNDIAPLELQVDWDNSGMQIDLGAQEVSKVLTCLDVCEASISQAVSEGCDFIVSHHPLFFNNINRVDADEAKGRYIIDCIKNGISVYSAHTCFDKAPRGNNELLLELLECYDWNAAGNEQILFTGMLAEPMPLKDLAVRIKEAFGSKFVRFGGDPERIIYKIAVCSGSGGDYIGLAASEGADCFISGDFKHHELMSAMELGLCIADAGHFGTEHQFAGNMGEQLRERCGDELEVVIGNYESDPLPMLV
ncbi:MAG: Nif3-like dinuclear metal center hexameric protein [Clostridiales bacterium]|nr:Nif3-like dinuclear metal center hexameric protein [Clostridiales bacterium]